MAGKIIIHLGDSAPLGGGVLGSEFPTYSYGDTMPASREF